MADFRPLLTDTQIRDKDIDTLKRFIRPRLDGYRLSFNDVHVGQPFFRGVPWKDRPTTVKQVSCPRPDLVTRFGRANRPGVPMFYASVAPPAVFYELRAKVGDHVAVSRWDVAKPFYLHHLGYHPDALRKLGAAIHPMRVRLINPISGEPRANGRLRRMLSLAFTEDIPDGEEYRYKQSIAVNELLFNKASPIPERRRVGSSDRVAGTAYPALKMNGAADNVAIWPEFVESSLRIRSVGYAVVEAMDETKLSYTILTLAMSHEFRGEEIIWPVDVGSEDERRRHISFENGR